MADTTFSNGTVIEASWLNDINDHVYDGKSFDDITIINVKAPPYNAMGDGIIDDTAAIQAALTAGNVYIPAGTYYLTSALTVPAGVTRHIHGEGPSSSILLFNGAAVDGIVSSHPGFVSGGSIRNLSIYANVAGLTGDGSSGTGIKIRGANGDFQVDNVDVRCFATALSNDGSYYLRLTNFQFLYCKNYGIRVPSATSGTAGAGSSYSNGKISNFGYTGAGTTHIGISVEESGGDYWSIIDVTSFATNRQIKPAAGKQVAYQFFVNVLSDTATNDNTIIDGSLGTVVSIGMTEDWTSFATNGSGMIIKGSGVDGVRWSGRARENGKHGIHIQGGKNVQIVASEIARNSKLTTLTYDGVHVDADVNDWAIEGGRIGNFASGLATEQADGIHIDAGTSQRFRIIGVDLSNAGTGKVPISNGSSSSNFVINNNLPIQAAGANQDRGGFISGNSIGTIAAAGTRYLHPNGQQATEGDAYILYGRPVSLSQFVVQTDVAPGAGQTYTYTIRVNGVDTTMTGTISGAAAVQAVLSQAQTIGSTDLVSIRVVTSAGAAAARHRWVLNADS